MDRDRGQESDGDVILGETCEGTVRVGPCRGHGDWDVTEQRWGSRRHDHSDPGRVAVGQGAQSVVSGPQCRPEEASLKEGSANLVSSGVAGWGRGEAMDMCGRAEKSSK